MTRNEAHRQSNGHRAKLEETSRRIRNASAMNARSMTSGEMDAGSIPVGSVEPAVVDGTTTSGFKVKVTVYNATYCGEATRKATSGEARAWLREQRVAWEARHGNDHERLKLRCRIGRISERLCELHGEAGDLVTDDTMGVMADAVALLNIAMKTIGADGAALTVAVAKRVA